MAAARLEAARSEAAEALLMLLQTAEAKEAQRQAAEAKEAQRQAAEAKEAQRQAAEAKEAQRELMLPFWFSPEEAELSREWDV